MKRSQVALVRYVFTAAGVVLLALAAFFYYSANKFVTEGVSATGKVVNMERGRGTHSDISTIVEFTTKEGNIVKFTWQIQTESPKYKIGQEVEVFYMPDNPEKATINSPLMWYAPLMIGFMGIVFFGTGFGMFLYIKRKAVKVEWLKMHGRRIETDFVTVEINEYRKLNNRHPYRIVTEYKEGGVTHTFRSDNIWYDPKPYVNRKKITVLVDPGNMEKYHMDISFVPEDEPEKGQLPKM